MNPLHLSARNYRMFGTLDIDLPDGCVSVIGANWAGKSSVVEAVELGLFGECRTGRMSDQLTTGVVDEELLLELEFEHADIAYRVRRTYNPRGRGKTTLDFERENTDGRGEPVGGGIVLDHTLPFWEPLTCESAKATQELIERTIGLSRETFRASAFLAQGDGAAFTEAQPRDRKRILAEVLGLDAWTVLAECARADRRILETRAAALTGRTAQAEEQAAALPELEQQHADTLEAETVAADNVADLERSHQELAVQYQGAREHAARRAAAEAELKTAEGALVALQTRDQDATKAAHDRAELTAALEKLPTYPPSDELRTREAELAAQCDQHARAVAAHEMAKRANDTNVDRQAKIRGDAAAHTSAADNFRAKIAILREQPDATCDTCKQHLPDEARAAAIATYEKNIVEHETEALKLRTSADTMTALNVPPAPAAEPPTVELSLARKTIDAANAAALERATLTERIRQCEQVATGGPTPDQMVAAQSLRIEKSDALEAVGTPPNIDAITADGNYVTEQLKTARTSLDQHKTQRARLDERILVARAAVDAVNAIAGEKTTLEAELAIVVALERAFSPDGVPALIVENSAIPYLETEANRILAELGTSFRVELRTQAALKSGDGLRDTLDVIVCSEKGERPYETFSGGERTRINLALRIALARLLAHRRGAESRLLVVDEPDGLDDAGMAALVDVLRSLEGDFDKLYIVSHVPGLRDSFDTTLSVVNDEHGSHVVEAGVFEAVAA